MKKQVQALIGLLLMASATVNAQEVQPNDSKKVTTEVHKDTTTTAKPSKTAAKKKKSDYEKLFDQNHTVAKGLMTVHKVKDKVYLEFPKTLLGKDFGIASTVLKTSESGHSIVGEKPHQLKNVRFMEADSCICMLNALHNTEYSANSAIENAFEQTSILPIIAKYKIEAMNPDSTAYVINVSALFANDEPEMDPFSPGSYITAGGMVMRTTKFKKAESFISGIKAFPSNLIIESTMTYSYSLSFMGITLAKDAPFTAVMGRSLFLLPEEKMTPRTADPRIGFFTTRKFLFTDEESPKAQRLVKRWRLEPSDKKAYERGELVNPKKPIIFYLDDKFPEFWKPYIKEGVESWNKAFARAGFKNAIRVKDFPKNDPNFDIADIRYSCIHYAPSANANAMGPSWADPRTGEIINASVYVYHNVIKILHDWRFLQTAQLDKRVRTEKFSKEVMGECISYLVAHEVGHCLGLMHNMAASAAYPVESLRSPEFVKKNGLSSSIMEYARFNYVAQPQDKGMEMGVPTIGEYDKYAIDWGYRYYNTSREKENQILRNLISEKIGNPIYRYGKQQGVSGYDPSAQTEDLGNDPVLASEYGIKNLKYILANMDTWFKEFDYDYSYTAEKYKALKAQYIQYLTHVYNVIGGIYLNEKFRGDRCEVYQVATKSEQQRALAFLMNELKEMDWVMDDNIIRNNTLEQPYLLNIQGAMLSSLITKVAPIAYGAYLKPGPEAYTPQLFYADLTHHIFGTATAERALSQKEMDWQNIFVGALARDVAKDALPFNSNLNALTDVKALSNYLESANAETVDQKFSCLQPFFQIQHWSEYSASFDFQQTIRPGTLGKVEAQQYAALSQIRQLIQPMSEQNGPNQAHYQFLLAKIAATIGGK